MFSPENMPSMAISAWPSPNRYSEHRNKDVANPKHYNKLVSVIPKSVERIDILFSEKPIPFDEWKIPRIVRQHMHSIFYHQHKKKTKHGYNRKRRNQIIRSVRTVLKFCFFRVNLKPNKNSLNLDYFEIFKPSIENIISETGYAKSTVVTALTFLEEMQLIRTKHNKEKYIDKVGQQQTRELPATRWLTPSAFKLLGTDYEREKLKTKFTTKAKKNENKNKNNKTQYDNLYESPGLNRIRNDVTTSKKEGSQQIQAILSDLLFNPEDDSGSGTSKTDPLNTTAPPKAF